MARVLLLNGQGVIGLSFKRKGGRNMLRETATVLSTSPEKAKVAIVRSEACGNCPAKNMCSTTSGKLNVLEVRNPIKAQPGQKVVIELQPRALVGATAMIYMVPTLSMVIGATLGWLRMNSDAGAMIGAFTGFVAATLFLYLHGRKERSLSGPVISEILPTRLVPRTHTAIAGDHDSRSMGESGYEQGNDLKHSLPASGA